MLVSASVCSVEWLSVRLPVLAAEERGVSVLFVSLFGLPSYLPLIFYFSPVL